MSGKRNFYEVLGVDQQANEDAIKKAFRRLAKQYHPDTNKEDDAEMRFIEVNEAYEVLSDPQKRQSYDRYGSADIGEEEPSRTSDRYAGTGRPGGGWQDAPDVGETPGQNTRSGRTRQERDGQTDARRGGAYEDEAVFARPGADVHRTLLLTLEEAVLGCEKHFAIPGWQVCTGCRGSGAKPGTSSRRCSGCQGSGEVRRLQQAVTGPFLHVTPCLRCKGSGRVTTFPCDHCQGQGHVRLTRQVTVPIPAGVEDHTLLRVLDGGEESLSGSETGTLYLHLEISPHPTFTRHGYDLVVEVELDMVEAALGTRLEVATLSRSREQVLVPAGTQSERVFRIRGQGVPVLHSRSCGDLLVRVHVRTPTEMTPEQRHLLEQFARLERRKSRVA